MSVKRAPFWDLTVVACHFRSISSVNHLNKMAPFTKTKNTKIYRITNSFNNALLFSQAIIIINAIIITIMNNININLTRGDYEEI